MAEWIESEGMTREGEGRGEGEGKLGWEMDG